MIVPRAIAIVGVAGRFPGASDVGGLWRNVIARNSAIREIPADRWPAPIEDMVNPASGVDHTCSLHAGLLEPFELETDGLDLPGNLLERLGSHAKLTLQVGRDCWNDAGLKVDKSRVGVVLANIALPTDGASKLAEAVLLAPLDAMLNIPPAAFEPLDRYPSALPAGLLARALGLGGGNYTLDAACASTLYAIHLACADLESGRIDAVIAGGVSLPQLLYTQVGFTQLQALSPSGTCSPFDKRADGLVVGEGAGMFVLRRLEDAVREGDRIHAVIRGIGLSNDVSGSLLSPEREGQLRAMRAAYRQAGWTPDDVQLVECHGTGTQLGDATEISSIRALFKDSDTVIGSVKSNVGHLLTAAGSVALCKVLCALEAEILPPSANYAQATQTDALAGSQLRVLEAPEPWPAVGGVRRAAISGFGFGGINAHMLIESYRPAAPASFMQVDNPPIAIVGMATHFGRLDTLMAFQHALFHGEAVRDQRPTSRWYGDARPAPLGAWLDALAMPLGRFKIPPREMSSLLPQQLLMLKVAAEALEDSKPLGPGPQLDAGVVIGIGLDLETTSFHLRWVLRQRLRAYLARQAIAVSPAEIDTWIARTFESLGPALDSTRTLGALGCLVPSRIAREFQFGGPSFTVANEEASGLRALEVAARMLQRGEARVMIAGAVDLAGDMRQVLATDAVRPYAKSGTARPFDCESDGPTIGEGAAAVVLKRLDDALRDGDRVYSVIRGLGLASSGALNQGHSRVSAVKRAMQDALREAALAPDAVALHMAHGSADPDEDRDEAQALGAVFSGGAVSAAAGIVGQTGASSGLASLIGAALSLFHEIIPPMASIRSAIPAIGAELHIAAEPQVWLRNRADGPRAASVGAMAIDGSAIHAVLEGFEHPPLAYRAERARPLGPRRAGIFLAERPDDLKTFALQQDGEIEAIAARWHRLGRAGAHAYVATDVPDLLRQLERVAPPSAQGPIAFVFPGSGNHFVGMGRSLGVAMPEINRALDAEVEYLAGQLMPQWVMPWRRSWGDDWPVKAAEALASQPERMMLGQVAHGVSVSDALRAFGLIPDAYIGYSLGESTGLFASRTWTARDLMFHRTLASPLFRTQLAGANEVAQQAWGAGDWHVVVVNRPAEQTRVALHGTAALLIVNAPNECVIGGRHGDVIETVSRLKCEALALEGVPTVHLPLVQAVASEYRALHELPTTPPEDTTFYSAAWAKAYTPTDQNAADSILGNAVDGFDFQALIEQAYADGIRVFIEPGPQASCTRMIGRILSGRPHVAVSADLKDADGFRSLLNAVARAAEAGAPIDLDVLYGADAGIDLTPPTKPQTVEIVLGGNRPPLPPPPLTVATITPRNAAPSAPAVSLSHAVGAAHEAFLKAAHLATAVQLQALAQQQELIAQLAGGAVAASTGDAPLFDRTQCMEFAVGQISAMLGPEFAAIDGYPTRVRLPDEPLMLVDRIIAVEGTKGVLGPGRVITEHDVLPGAWYLDGGRAPVCVSVEAGQADLFLSAYLGIDFETLGHRVYRLLDAQITFHRDLPVAGETIRYDIRIDRFIRQGDTWLFFFCFEGTIAGQPFITMSDGCAGFFSAEQLDSGRGIVDAAERALPPRRPGAAPFAPLLHFERQALSDAQLDALREGALAKAFGAQFEGKRLASALWLPRGRMHLVDRILEMDPAGGRWGQGLVCGEAEIDPEKWFLTCHFIDDPVMPGTLMYECCVHNLRVLLLRMGWITDETSLDVHLAPVEGQTSRLRCRGQVLPGTKMVGYRIEIREMGYDPEPYVIADASMFADCRHIVEMEGMSVRIRGLTREMIEATWRDQPENRPVVPVVHTREQILAYAEGNPSEAFGPQYLPFDRDRRLARLPRPPFLFLDRVTSAEPPPWVLKPGGWIESAFDVDPQAWYFAANRQPSMPFAVLLEAALQPCGWLSAYVGSALASSEDLHYRNLDGFAMQHAAVFPDAGTLTSRARMTKTSHAGGMILQEFEMQILKGSTLVYDGTTGFGFFPGTALAQQVGIRGAAMTGGKTAQGPNLVGGDADGGFAMPTRTLSMIDRIDVFQRDGGSHGLGFIAGSKSIDADEWFFTAHFHQDPVMPGSLGLEAMLQLLKVFAREQFGHLAATHRFETMAVGVPHRWQYRGQVVPTNGCVTVEATITGVTEDLITADGFLAIDGRVIYAMSDFTLRLVQR